MDARRWLVILVLLLVAAPTRGLAGEQWGHWRGPTGNGVAPDARPPVHFGAAKNVRWKTEIPGRGSSSPVVWGDDVFVTTAVLVDEARNEHEFLVLCFDRAAAGRWS